MKKLLSCLFILLSASVIHLYGFEENLPGLEVPSNLNSNNLVFSISHRFRDDVLAIPQKGYLTGGANIMLGLKYNFGNHIEAYTGFHRDETEFKFGLRYTMLFPNQYLRSMIQTEFFTYQDPRYTPRSQNFFILAAFQNEPLFERLTGTLNLGYDLYHESLEFGLGLSFKINDTVHLFTEFAMPVLYNSVDLYSKMPFYALGIKFETYGHHFLFTFGNSTQMGARRVLMGADMMQKIYFGFMIERLFEF